ncbi:3' histone mRNA exonuclease, putative [Pediculus humanus corporis]|uniref:3' histone mRNA exonuclease, putative n=1 Tax=Pediculus humanus subsp. corporis TaxID=121224 RepID=E0VUL5_PEDHC|nr:3' histone mRNA exonuclease, putative [Pediculus humanus corporis]EEB17071.1 3' histone mRNA exonuclease, putative [Pediculus humanus corporis]
MGAHILRYVKRKLLFKYPIGGVTNLKKKLCTNLINSNTKIDNYDYLLILDFEATCDKKKFEQEIIEFPCLKINMNTLREESRFHKYVRPVINPKLTNFCTELTGIIQEMVDDEPTFNEVYLLFEQWRKSEGLTDDNSIYVTSGDWDLGYMMPRQCAISKIQVPSHMMTWIDIKKLYGINYNCYCGSLIEIFRVFNIEFDGRNHSGIIKRLSKLNIKFTPTSNLTLSKNGYKVQSKKI